MKKLFAATTAVAMLSTCAFAAGGDNAADPYGVGDNEYVSIGVATDGVYVATGSKLVIEASDFVTADDDAFNLDKIVSGEDYNNISAGAVGVGAWEFNDEYFSVSRRTYIKGADLVSNVYFDDNETDDEILVVELKESRTLTNVTTPNFQINEIRVKAKKDSAVDTDNNNGGEGEFFARNQEFVYAGEDAFIVTTFTVVLEDSVNLDLTPGAVNYASGITSYNEVEGDYSDIYLYGRAYKNDQIFFDVTEDYDLEILKANPTADDIRFYQVEFDGASATWNIELQVNEDDYVYEVKNGQLTATTLVWSDDVYAWAGKTRTDMSFVVSDVALNAVEVEDEVSSSVDTTVSTSTGTTTTLNPSTGANDVVGVAAALAVVSLIAGAAVSLKK